ncbi:MAG: DUF4339 domain-containing protein [Planctomycetota bacterium]
MGIRFACHGCGKRLNIKSELAGRRGICPACAIRFRIPNHDCETSTPIETSETDDDVSLARKSSVSVTNSTNGSASDTAVSQEPAVFGGRNTTWYVRPPSGGQYGPADGPTMRQWLGEGRVAETSMVWRDGWNDWRAARSTFDTLPEAPWTSLTPNGVTPIPDETAATDGPPPALSAAEIPTPSAEITEVDPLKSRGAPLASNQRNRSRKRMAASVAMVVVFVALLATLVLVVL